MKRLTERDEYGNADILGVDMPELQLPLDSEQMNLVTDALNKLAEYEETGLTPREIRRLTGGEWEYLLLPERDLIYLASPYGGKHENYTRAQRDMMILTETYRQYDFISPIVSYGFCYDNYSYDDGIAQCLGLLSHCDQLWILHDDGESRGVKIERKFAAEHNIPIKEGAESV